MFIGGTEILRTLESPSWFLLVSCLKSFIEFTSHSFFAMQSMFYFMVQIILVLRVYAPGGGSEYFALIILFTCQNNHVRVTSVLCKFFLAYFT